MNVIKTCKNIFYFLRYVFVKIFGVTGALLILIGGLGLFFAQRSQDKALYLILASVGYVIIVVISCFGLEAMNQKEIKSSRSLKEGK